MALVCDIKSNISEEDPASKPDEEDLEDGEIEDDDEEQLPEAAPEPPKNESTPPPPQTPIIEVPKKIDERSSSSEKIEKPRDRSERRRHDGKARREEKGHKHMTEAEKSILHLRKREKMLREKWEKVHRKDIVTDPMDDDFAKNIEKTLATILSKKEKEAAGISGGEEREEDKRGKKRKKHEKDRQKNKQRRTIESPKSEEIDENEMLNIHSGSPVEPKPNDKKSQSPSRSEESFDSEYSTDHSRGEEKSKRREAKRENKRNRERNRRERERRNNDQQKLLQDSQGVCVFYMQGKCQKNDCPYSHETNPPMKLELCKFYLMECCAKGDKCSYMHSEFPCKFYHTGLQCTQGDDCKFAHGKHLSEGLKQILFKHIETAPRDILGGFPRMSREEALNMINATQKKLEDQYGTSPSEENKEDTAGKGGIPSLFDINVPVPPELIQGIDDMNKIQGKSEKTRNRPSRWQEPDPLSGAASFPLKGFAYGSDQDMRINSNGDIDMRTLPPTIPTATPLPLNNIPGKSSETTPEAADADLYKREAGVVNPPKQDVDIRSTSGLLPFAQDIDIRQQNLDPRFLSTMDVDIRLLSSVFGDNRREEVIEQTVKESETETEDEAMLQIDTGEDKTEEPAVFDFSKTTRDLFSRIQAQQKEQVEEVKKTEERFDLDDTNINWYSDDDDEDENRLMIKVEEDEKVKEKVEEEQNTSESVMSPPQIKPLDVVGQLGDLSKIDISAEVTKLLTSMSQNRNLTSLAKETTVPKVESSVPIVVQDPRTARQDPRTSSTLETARIDPRLTVDPRQRSRQSSTETQDKKSEKMSIYEQGSIDTKSEVDTEFDFLKGSLRPDIDLRHLTLPFKGMENYTPASEIDASINSHPPIQWKIYTVEIPRPDYHGLKLSINDAEKTGDPRLRKIFRLSTEEKDSPMSPKASPKSSASVRVDPRLRKMEAEKNDGQMNYNQQLNMLQASAFYQSLTSNQKLLLNQELATRSDQTGSHDPVLNTLLSNLNILPGANAQGNHNMASALSILANINKINPMLPPNNHAAMLNQPPMMVQQGLLGAAPGIPNLPPDFNINFDPRNGGLLGNAPPQGFGGFPPNEGNFNSFGDDFYPPEGNFAGHNNRDNNRGFNNRDRRRGRNFNNRNNRNFRNNNRNNHRTNRNHSPP